MQKSSKKGFTLIELMVVVFIIGILAAIVIVSLTTARARARDARRLADVKTLKNGIDQFYIQRAAYPAGGNCMATQNMATLRNTINTAFPNLLPVIIDPGRNATFDYEYMWGGTGTPCTVADGSYGILVKFDLPRGASTTPVTIGGVTRNECVTGTNLNLHATWWTTSTGTAIVNCDF